MATEASLERAASDGLIKHCLPPSSGDQHMRENRPPYCCAACLCDGRGGQAARERARERTCASRMRCRVRSGATSSWRTSSQATPCVANTELITAHALHHHSPCPLYHRRLTHTGIACQGMASLRSRPRAWLQSSLYRASCMQSHRLCWRSWRVHMRCIGSK